MRVLVVYDSQWGNTEAVARGIGGALGADAMVRRAADATAADLAGVELLLVGSPTQGGRPLPTVSKFVGDLDTGALRGVKAAAFDTRLRSSSSGFGLRLLMRTIGYAEPRLAKSLRAKDAPLAAEPEGFFVAGKEGPLEEGEIERAAAWARGLLVRAGYAPATGGSFDPYDDSDRRSSPTSDEASRQDRR